MYRAYSHLIASDITHEKPLSFLVLSSYSRAPSSLFLWMTLSLLLFRSFRLCLFRRSIAALCRLTRLLKSCTIHFYEYSCLLPSLCAWICYTVVSIVSLPMNHQAHDMWPRSCGFAIADDKYSRQNNLPLCHNASAVTLHNDKDRKKWKNERYFFFYQRGRDLGMHAPDVETTLHRIRVIY